MADFYVDSNGKVTKRKKKNSVAYIVDANGTVTRVDDDDDDIAPVRQDIVKREEDDSKLDFFQKSKAFDDGWQFGDLAKTILGTAGDAVLEVGKGLGSLVEGVTDAVQYGVAGITDVLGADEFAERTRKRAMENRIEQWTENLDNRLEQNSVLGRTSDAILQGVGQVGGIVATGGIAGAAGLGSAGATLATTGLMGISGFGSGAGEAYKAGATDGEAMTYGLISGAADAFTELLFGGLGKAVGAVGLSKGLSSADDLLAQKVSNLFTSQITKNFAEYGIKAGAEGVEEVLAGVLQAAGKKITYMQDEELLDIVKDENLLEQFVVGAATSGMIQSGVIPGTSKGSLKEANAEGRDFITGYNQNEQSVIDKEVEKRVAAQEQKGGTKLTKKEIGAIEKAVQEDLDKGGIDIDTIEEVLGGETYSNYKKLVDAEEKMQAEYDELGKKEHYTLADDTRYRELGERLKYVREKGAKNELRKRLDDEVATLTKDSRLVESFNERSRRGQKFEADVSKYNEKQRAIVQKAIDSGILNNTRRSHEFVDLVARIAADKGVAFDFTNNAKLKESGFAVQGKTVNGFVTKDGITINIQSSKSLNSVVGHEIAHVLEGTELYTELQNAVFQYAETKGDVADRRAVLEKLYEGVEDANIDAELTADLVGDYLFTDSDFISRLSTENRNVFQKIYDEVKYLLKVATAGSKEARQLEQVKRAFEKAYRASGSTAENSGTTYSMSQQGQTAQGSYDYTKSFADQITDYQKGAFPERDVFVLGGTPEVLKKIGLVGLPLTINQKHVQDSLNGTYAGTQQEKLDHTFTPQELATLPEKIADPIAIIYDKRVGKKNASESVVDVLVEMTVASGKQVIAAVQVGGNGHINGLRIDTNKVATAHGNTDSLARLADAINENANGNVALFYVNNKKAINSFLRAGNPIPGGLNDLDGFLHSITESGSPVKNRISSVTESAQFKRWFGDWQNHPKDASKIVNADGTPKVMYHGSNAKFTVFDKSKAKSSGLYGKGFYFTDSSSHAGTYGSQYEVYLDIRNPLQDGAATVTRDQVRGYLEAIAENEDYSIENYGTYDIDEVLDIVMGKSKSADAFKVIQDINATAVGDMVEAAELFNTVNGTNFDGIVVPTETIAFRPEQIKSATDNIGTFDGNNPDIRFSLSEEIEPTDRLVAVHNKSVRGLQRMLDRGGVPFASIAIKKAGASHEGFGEVSIVFPRATIDPEGNRWNKLYSNDAWTPTEPHMEYDVGDTYKYKKLFENMLGSDIYNALRGASYLDSDALERELGSSGGDVFEAVKRLGVVKYGYLQSIGQRPEMTTKQKSLDGFGRYKNDQLMAVFEALDGETIRSATYDSEDVLQQIADTLNEQFMQQLPNDDSVFKSFKKKPLYTADKINIVAIQDAYEAWEAAGRTIPTEPDTYALENAMRDNRELEEDEGYRRWVEDVFDGLIKDSGIPNGRDYYTPSGNRRSFQQLHVPATLENIVQQMRKENETGIGSLGSINLRGAATKTYATVEEMRADSGKLLGTHIDDDVYDGYMDGFHARLNELKLKAAKGDSWSSRDTAEQVLLEAVRDAKTKASMASKLRKEAQWINYEPALVDELWQLKQDVQNMPAPYFEAKPRRIVTTDEAAAYIVPDNAPASLFAKLDEMGLAYKTYKAGDEADRLAQLNSVLDEQPDLRFSLSAEGAEQRAFGSYNVRGEDIALEGADIAPVRQDIAPMAVANNATTTDAPVADQEETVLSPYDELDQLEAHLEELEQRQEELLAAGEYEQAEALLVEMGPASARMTELQNQIEELEAQQAAEQQERLASFTDEDAPVPGEPTHSEDTDTVTLPTKRRNDIAAKARKALGFARNRVSEMRELVDKFSQGEIDDQMLFDEIAERFGTYTETSRDEEVAEVRNWLKTTRIHVSDDVKSNFADYGKSVFRPNRGRLLFSNAGQDVDLYYAELADKFPGFFPSDIANPADQLQRIIEVANYDINTEQSYEMDDEMLQGVVDEIVMSVNEYRRSQRQAAAEASIANANASIAQDNNVPAEEDIAPVRADVADAEDVAPVRSDVEQKPIGGQTINTMQERLDAKVQHLQTELENTKRQREGAVSYYQRKMAEKKAEYDRRKNKNTKAAYANLRSVERYMRIGSSIDADFAKKISDLEGRVAKASEEARNGESKEVQGAMRKELQASFIEKARTKYAEQGYDMDEVFKNAKDLSTWSTVDNTPQRVMEKALGYKEGQIFADLTVNQVARNETEGIRWLNGYTDRKTGLLAQISKQYGIKPGTDESAAAQMYAEGFYVAENGDIIAYGDRELAEDFPDAKVQANIKGLARDPRIRQIYDATLAMINESRARNAYPEIQKLDNYFLHFRAMDDTFSRLGIPFNPNDIKAKDLPTDLNGVTADLKPGQPYFASAMHRKGKRTSFDLLGGLERYLTSAKGQIYHIDDIQMLRALRNYIADSFGQAHGLEGLDALTEEEVQDRIEDVYGAHLSTFAKFLNEEANVIAGKTALIDRGLEGIIGRRGMTFFDTLNRQVGANMVGFNVSSSLTNFIAPVQAFAKTNKAAFMKGFAQTVANRIGAIRGKTDGFAENNPTMIRRKGADQFYRTPWQKISDLGYALMGGIDSFSTEIIVRSKYNELIAKGVSGEQAVEWADKWASRLMGDRSIGQQPQLYNSKMAGLVTKFQLEVRNQLDSQFYDTIQEAKVSAEDIQNKQARNAKVAAQVASTFVQLAVVQHLFGKAFEAVAGYNPAFDIIEAIIKAFGWDDEEESEDTVLDNLGQGLLSIAEDMPYFSVLSGTGRIPISSALPVGQFVKGEDKYGNEKSRLETIAETAPYYLLPGGYGQIKKTVQGLGMFDDDLPIAGSYTDSGNLRFTVDDTFENRVQAAVFGQWASSNAREYFDNEYKPLQEKQIQELVDSGLSMKEYRDYRDGLKDLDTLGEKVAYIADLDLPIDTKNLLVNNIADREEPIDLTDFDEYSDWGEFEYAHKYPKKYDFLTANNISVAQYEAFDEDTKKAWTWAYQNPEKFALSRAVSDDLMVYRQYSEELSEIKADKYADGRTVNGSRKTKVLNYLNNLDADYYTKLILFKMEYNADDTYNREIIEYLNGREDISFEEEVTILKELGFTVTADGTVRW